MQCVNFNLFKLYLIIEPYNILFLIYKDISELLVKRSVLALVNDKVWDMNKPLEQDCTVKFLHFKDVNPFHPNIVRKPNY